MSQFVVLEHRVDGGKHWDFLFERPAGELLTWQVASNPFQVRLQPARQLADHRRVYLTYRGPVLLNRGLVQQVDGGSFEWIHHDDSAFRARLSGRRFRGLLTLEAAARDASIGPWRYQFQFPG